jgi:hypothetical protein
MGFIMVTNDPRCHNYENAVNPDHNMTKIIQHTADQIHYFRPTMLLSNL